jgi:FkbM family methyltransferase
LAWRAGLGGKRPILLELAGGERLVLRPPPSTDLNTAMEIFFCEVYRSPRPLGTDRICKVVDLGSNVGYSIVYFSRAFPQATIEAYEPHPGHMRQISRHIAANGLESRVTLHAVAAGNRSCRMFLTDAENQSSLVSQEGPGRFEVAVVDWLAAAAGRPIDFLKMDVEGAEYEILFDARFANLEISNIVVEWHETPAHPTGDQEVLDLMQRLGYQVERGFQDEFEGIKSGLIWGYRR